MVVVLDGCDGCCDGMDWMIVVGGWMIVVLVFVGCLLFRMCFDDV